jgi:hypothetical protein
MLWMHVTVVSLLHKASPELSNKFEHDHGVSVDDEAPFIDRNDLTQTGARS